MADEPDSDAPATEERTAIRIADHPRAKYSIGRAKSWGAIVGFALTAWLSYRGGIPFVDLVIRSIAIGALASLGVWAVAQMVWKQILFAELAHARKEALELQKTILEELEDPSRIDQSR
ncbi:MAG: hypothetical protein PGN13_06975 [Patulibacter minatonensis]